MPRDALLPFFVALAFSALHIWGPSMAFLRTQPRSAWLSIAGGVSVAYVFIHLLPELAGHQQAFSRATESNSPLQRIERHVYAIALFGLAVFYGLDRLARRTASHGRAGRPRHAGRPTFWLHLASFALYNMLIGYLLLHREEQDRRGLAIYAVAMALHFIVNDQGLRENHGEVYDEKGRWVLALAPLLGFVLGLATQLSLLTIAAMFAFLAGGVVLNVLKEELPEERESRFWAFAAGAAAYAALLMATAG